MLHYTRCPFWPACFVSPFPSPCFPLTLPYLPSLSSLLLSPTTFLSLLFSPSVFFPPSSFPFSLSFLLSVCLLCSSSPFLLSVCLLCSSSPFLSLSPFLPLSLLFPQIFLPQMHTHLYQELMNRYARRSVKLAYPSCIESHFQTIWILTYSC